MKITIDNAGYDIVARDEAGRVVARRKTNCNPAALAQIIADAEAVGEIDWDNSQVAKPEAALYTHQNMSTTKYGNLCDYKTSETIRPATEQEWRESREAEASGIGGGTGVIEVDGRSVYVEGGAELE